jgi:hypothetical protein
MGLGSSGQKGKDPGSRIRIRNTAIISLLYGILQILVKIKNNNKGLRLTQKLF